MRESQLIEYERKKAGGNLNQRTFEGASEPVAANPIDASIMSEYEEVNGVPYIVDKLNLKNDFVLDSKVQVKARAVEEYFVNKMKEDGLRDSKIGYETLLARALSRLPEPFERMMQQNNALKILDILFREVAMESDVSGETYLKEAEEDFRYRKVNQLKGQLKQLLATI